MLFLPRKTKSSPWACKKWKRLTYEKVSEIVCSKGWTKAIFYQAVAWAGADKGSLTWSAAKICSQVNCLSLTAFDHLAKGKEMFDYIQLLRRCQVSRRVHQSISHTAHLIAELGIANLPSLTLIFCFDRLGCPLNAASGLGSLIDKGFTTPTKSTSNARTILLIDIYFGKFGTRGYCGETSSKRFKVFKHLRYKRTKMSSMLHI